jgi:hypothetical protein
MAATSCKSVSINYSDILDAFEFVSVAMPYEHRAYICADAGTIHLSSADLDDEEDLPDDLETSDRYIEVPQKNELNLGQTLVFSFVRQELPDDLDDVRDIFRKMGAYGRFKGLLQARGRLEKWYAFEERATEATLRAWCQDVGIQLTDPPTRTATG